eukprot:COSAG02_NODE_667_length_18713_cov_17.795262_14_plen_293_part_00
MVVTVQLFDAPANPARALAAALFDSLALQATPTLLPAAEPGAWTVLFDNERDAAAAVIAAADLRLFGRAMCLQKAGPGGAGGGQLEPVASDIPRPSSTLRDVDDHSDSSDSNQSSDQDDKDVHKRPEAGYDGDVYADGTASTSGPRGPPDEWLRQRRAEAQLKEMLGPSLYRAFTMESNGASGGEQYGTGEQLATELVSLASGSTTEINTIRGAAEDALGSEGRGQSCPSCAGSDQPNEPEPKAGPELEHMAKPLQRQLLELDAEYEAQQRKRQRKQQLRKGGQRKEAASLA